MPSGWFQARRGKLSLAWRLIGHLLPSRHGPDNGAFTYTTPVAPGPTFVMIRTRLASATKRSISSPIRTQLACLRLTSTAGAASTKGGASTPQEIQTIRGRLLHRIHAKVPSFLHPYAAKLVNAPVTHLTSFLILHEITAVVPLFGLAAVFHFSDWIPTSLRQSEWVTDGIGKYGHWFRRRGWLDKSGEDTEIGTSSSTGVFDRESRFRMVLE